MTVFLSAIENFMSFLSFLLWDLKVIFDKSEKDAKASKYEFCHNIEIKGSLFSEVIPNLKKI